MSTTTRAYLQFRPNGPLELKNITLPEPGPYEVLVEIDTAGICHSQAFYMTVDRDAPMLFGHEGVGRVVHIGSQVTAVEEGDRVLATWIPDNRRDLRPAGRARALLDDGLWAESPQIFVWAEHAVLDEKYLKRLPSEVVSTSSLAVLGCAVPTGFGAATNSVRIEPGDHVAVIGIGGVGLSAVRGAALRGAERIYAIDLSPEKAEWAKQFGATDARTSDANLGSSILSEIRSDGGTAGVDVVIDCVANNATFSLSTEITRPGVRGKCRGGAIVLVGIPEAPFTMDAFSLINLEKTVVGSLGGSSTHADLDDLLHLHTSGEFDLTPLVTNQYAFEDIPMALDDLISGKVLGRAVANC